MKTIIKVLLGAIVTFFAMRQCEAPAEIRTVTKVKNVPTYIDRVHEVKIPVTTIKYKKITLTDTAYVRDTLDNLVEVVTYDTTQSLAVIPYQDSLVTINDSITLTGTILDFKRQVVVKERQPDTLMITKEVTKYFSGIKYYVGLDSDVKDIFQPAFGLSYDTKKYQVSLGYRPTTKIVEARFFLPLIKF